MSFSCEIRSCVFLVFTSHSSLLLLHVNSILSTTFAHKTTTWRILRCSFLPQPYIILYVFKDIFLDLQSEYKNKNHVDICPKQMHLGNSSDSLNRYTYTYKTWKKKKTTKTNNTMRWLKKLSFIWLNKSLCIRALKATPIDPQCMSLRWGKAIFDNPFTKLKYVLCSPILSLVMFFWK